MALRAPMQTRSAREKDPSRQLVSIEDLRNRDRVMEICGACHRTLNARKRPKNRKRPGALRALPGQKRVLQEQPYALMRYLPQPTYGRRNEHGKERR